MLSRLRALYFWLGYRVFTSMASMYVAAASLIGFETLALLLGYATMSPVAVPIMIAGIALWAVIRRRLHGGDRGLDSAAPRGTVTGEHPRRPGRDEGLQ